eukprot:gb/GECG01004143.1/.p1 GENE.gb/GECG01004143.1/~~gb/GECG01004143.1/.p1  ORF type:complete len:275 (+),score=15.09 gb/GECG01004143.1/:1-825(+)
MPKGKTVAPEAFQGLTSRLYNLSDEKLEYLYGNLPIFIGMRAVITKNVAPELGLVNGSPVEVVGFVWGSAHDEARAPLEPYKLRIPGSATNSKATSQEKKKRSPAEVLTITARVLDEVKPKMLLLRLIRKEALQARAQVHLPGLPPDVVPLQPFTTTLTYKPGPGAPTFRVNMKQMPLGLGSAVTTHKLQGMTVDSELYIDELGKEAGSALGGAYTALSRVRTLDTIHLVHELDPTKAARWSLKAGLAEEQQRLQSISDHYMRLYLQTEQIETV